VAAIQPAGTTTSNVVSYSVAIAVDPTDAPLLPGMTATVTIITGSASDVVTVPSSAISNGSVNVLRDGVVTPVKVQAGVTDGVTTEIVSGLQRGEQVVMGSNAAPTPSRSTSTSGTGARSILNTGGAPGRPN
jgi:HlyD family secretion protein